MDKKTTGKPSTGDVDSKASADAIRHLRRAAAALVPEGEENAANCETYLAWSGIQMLVVALRKPDGECARMLRSFVHEQQVLTGFLYEPDEAAERVPELDVSVLERFLSDVLAEDDGGPPWERARQAVAEWALVALPGAKTTIYANGTSFTASHEAKLKFWALDSRFIAQVALALPRAYSGPISALAKEVIEGTGDVDELAAALGPAWDAAERDSKHKTTRGAEWFLARALEACGEDPHVRRTAERMRKSRDASRLRVSRRKKL